MRIPGLRRLKQSGRWLRGRFFGQAMILGYHRIADVNSDPYGMTVSPQNFARHLEAISRYAQPISLPCLIRGLKENNLPRSAVAITIDDGYADVLYEAKPLLQRYQIPATVFMTTGDLGEEFWWNKLERIIFSAAILPRSLSLTVSDWNFDWQAAEGRQVNHLEMTSKQDLLQSLYHRLLPLSSAQQGAIIDQLRSRLADQLDDPPCVPVLTVDELIELAAGDEIEIGSHTVTHPQLAGQPTLSQQQEVERSKVYLETILRRPVTSFSYPNGSYSESTKAMVAEAGYDYACASYQDVVWQQSDLFQLPRFWPADWNGERFSHWLRQWLPN
jgi:peptidoglycan/xylan/chitin deacetylase (PgdA/CDA1 family)